MDTKTDARPGTRRRHGPDLKRQVLAECAAPGASVAKVATTHGLNANLVHKWRRRTLADGGVVEATFVPVTVAAPTMVNEPMPVVDLAISSCSVATSACGCAGRWQELRPARPGCARSCVDPGP